MSTAPNVDWERIELQYRAGLMTLREIASEHGITHAAVTKRAKRDGWARDLNAKIQAKAAALVAKREVSKEVAAERLVTEREVVEAGAVKVAEVLTGHKRIAADGLRVVEQLIAEVHQVGELQEHLMKLGELMRDPEAKVDKLNDLYHRIISWGGRAGTIKSISDSAKNLIAIQREAYSIKADAGKDPEDPASVDKDDLARRVIYMLAERCKIGSN